jgi:ubiquinone/menaquinone biosynthesis C-methylase UbiE
MGFYSNVVIPIFYDFSMDSQKINKGRKRILSRVAEEEILEIGFGTGINLKFYPENVKKITGVDINKGMLKQFRKKSAKNGIEIDLLHQSGESFPFPDQSS